MAYPSATIAPEHAALLGHRIDKGRLQFVSVLGLGAYGVVYLAQDVSAQTGGSSAHDPASPYSGQGYYAVKCLNKTGLDQRQKSFQRREIALHTLASQHDSIVSMHRVVETSSIIYVILAFCPDGDLFSMITEQSRYLGDDELIRSVFLQIVDAIDFCHRLGIYHRDLKPENILCCDGGRRVLLADFGLATTEKTSADFGCGSTFYMSPECQGGIHHRVPSYSTLHNDIWSLGVILVNLTCGRNPWKQATPSDETFRAYLEDRNFLRSILPISNECNELLKRIFALDPADRISIAEIRHRVLHMRQWTMTEDELSHATKATREAARALPQHQAPAVQEPVYVDGLSSDESSEGSESSDPSFGSSIVFPNRSNSFQYSPMPETAEVPRLIPAKRPALQDHSNMDVDDPSRTPVVPSTPKQNRQRPLFRRTRGSPQSNSSSSSNESWGDLPPTPDTPTFLRQMQQKARPEVDMASAIQRIETMASNASSKASFEAHYQNYSDWADQSPTTIRVPPASLKGRTCDAKHSLAQLLESPMPRKIKA